MTSDPAGAVETANGLFYKAIETGDLDLLQALWAESADVVCIHPGWPMIRGRDRVLRSWAVIMANTEWIEFFLTDVEVSVDGRTAWVTCVENVLDSGPDEGQLAGSLGRSARIVALNLFRATPDGWRIVAHHASPVLVPDPPLHAFEEPGDG